MPDRVPDRVRVLLGVVTRDGDRDPERLSDPVEDGVPLLEDDPEALPDPDPDPDLLGVPLALGVLLMDRDLVTDLLAPKLGLGLPCGEIYRIP